MLKNVIFSVVLPAVLLGTFLTTPGWSMDELDKNALSIKMRRDPGAPKGYYSESAEKFARNFAEKLYAKVNFRIDCLEQNNIMISSNLQEALDQMSKVFGNFRRGKLPNMGDKFEFGFGITPIAAQYKYCVCFTITHPTTPLHSFEEFGSSANDGAVASPKCKFTRNIELPEDAFRALVRDSITTVFEEYFQNPTSL